MCIYGGLSKVNYSADTASVAGDIADSAVAWLQPKWFLIQLKSDKFKNNKNNNSVRHSIGPKLYESSGGATSNVHYKYCMWKRNVKCYRLIIIFRIISHKRPTCQYASGAGFMNRRRLCQLTAAILTSDLTTHMWVL